MRNMKYTGRLRRLKQLRRRTNFCWKIGDLSLNEMNKREERERK